jgi:hypothetical protein
MTSRKMPRPVLGPSAFLGQAAGDSSRHEDPRRAPGQAEASHFARLVDSKQPVKLTLRDGSVLEGVLEWHDRGALRVNLAEGRHLVVPKTSLALVEPVAT